MWKDVQLGIEEKISHANLMRACCNRNARAVSGLGGPAVAV